MVRSAAGLVVLFLTGCVSPLRSVPLSQPESAYVIFFADGAVLGTLGASAAPCEALRQPTGAPCTPVLVTPAGAEATTWVAITGRRAMGVMVIRLVGAETETACRELLRSGAPDLPGLACQPVRLDRR